MNELLPREKAYKYGISTLQDEELLSLILKTGCQKKNVIELSKEVLDKAGGIENLCSYDYEELLDIKGFGMAKAMELMAIIELSKRMSSLNKVEEETIKTPENLANWIRFNIAFSSTEKFFALFMNRQGSIIKSEVLFKGTRTSSLVGIDEVLRRAILLHADSIVIAHNHPGGSLIPSKADISLTDKIGSSLSLMDIRLLDHIIVSRTGYYSFRKEGLII